MPRIPWLGTALTLALLTAATRSAVAAEWAIDPSLAVQGVYNDNIRFVTGVDDSTSGVVLTPKVSFDRRTEISEVRSSAELRSTRYSGSDDLNTNGWLFNFNSKLQSERQIFQLDGSFNDDSVLTTEAADPDAGLASTRTKRKSSSVSPAWSWALTETTQVRIDYRYSEARYENGPAVDLYDYYQNYGGLTLSHNHSTATQTYLSLGHSDFESEFESLESTTDTGQIGISHAFSQTLNSNLSVGKRVTHTSRFVCSVPALPFLCPPLPKFISEAKEDGLVFNGSLEKKFLRTYTRIGASRTTTASGSGSEVEADSATLAIDHRLSSRLNAGLNLDGSRYRAIGGNAALIDRDYFRVEPKLRWRWTEELSAELAYRYTKQEYDNQTDQTTANAVYLTFTYRWPKISISR